LECKGSPLVAVKKVHKLLERNLPEAELKERRTSQQPMFEFLRFAGLEKWTWLFESHGCYRKRQLKELELNNLENWHPEFHLKSSDYMRLKSLLESDGKNKDLAEYELADITLIKDIFLAAYLPDSHNREKKIAEGHSLDNSSRLASSASGLSILGLEQKREETALENLAKEFQGKLCKCGKSLVSIYQVRSYIERYLDSPSLAVEHAFDIIRPRRKKDQQHRMNLEEFLWRAGLNVDFYHWRIKAAGVNDPISLMSFVNQRSINTFFSDAAIMDNQAKTILKALSYSKDFPLIRAGFLTPPFSLVVERISDGFSISDSSARRFARRITEFSSSFSVNRLEAFIERWCNAGGVEEAAKHLEDLSPPTEVKMIDYSDTWIFKWLQGFNLEKHVHLFTHNDIFSRDDVTKPSIFKPKIALIGSLGEQRRLQNAMKILEDEVKKEEKEQKNKEEEAEKARKKEADEKLKEEGDQETKSVPPNPEMKETECKTIENSPATSTKKENTVSDDISPVL